MILRSLIPFIAFLCLACVAHAADSTAVDTMKVRVSEVVVEEHAFLTSDADAVRPTTTLDRSMLSRLAPVQAHDALVFVPGLAIRNYGGVGGMKTVSMRGGSAAQSLVLINGIRLSSAQNGQLDLSAIPMSMIDRIDVQRGGASALYGANAMTGVVNMKLSLPNASQASSAISLGSFNEQHATASGSAVTQVGAIGASIDLLTSSGAYPYDLSMDGAVYDVNRANSDVRNLNGMLFVRPSAAWSVFGLVRSSQRGVPGAVVQGSTSNANARMDESDMVVGLSGRIPMSGSTDILIAVGTRYWDQRYTDPDATFLGQTGLNERFLLRDASVSTTLRSTTEQLAQSYRVDASFADLRGATLQPGVASTVQRRQLAVSGQWQWNATTDVTMEGGLRADAYSDVGTAISPLLAVRWRPAETYSVRSSVSYNFRPPAFTELYYLNYGTATLQPERSLMLDVGCTATPTSWLSCEVSIFHANTSNQIISVPTSPVSWSAQNVGLATTTGIEVGARALQFADKLMLHVSYTLQDARDRTGRSGLDGTLLPYVPQELFSGGMHWRDAAWMSGWTWSYSSFRYALPGAQYTSILQPFGVIQAYVGVHAETDRMRVNVRASVDNLFNERYVIVRGYPMPGRMFRIMMDVSI